MHDIWTVDRLDYDFLYMILDTAYSKIPLESLNFIFYIDLWFFFQNCPISIFFIGFKEELENFYLIIGIFFNEIYIVENSCSLEYHNIFILV